MIPFRSFESNWPHAGVLAVVFACLYVAIGPGCLFTVDEVVVQEMAQSFYQRRTLDVPAMNTAAPGLGGSFYAHRGPVLGYAAVPFVALGNFLDDHFGSLKGGAAAGPPVGTAEHPLRWGGRLSIFTALIFNALVGGMTVSLLFLTGLRLGAAESAAMLMAIVAGLCTLLASESTHFLQHPLETLGLLLGFWFLSDRETATLARRAFFGSLSLGLAVLARPNAAPAALIIWLFGAVVAWKATGSIPDRSQKLVRPGLFAAAPLLLCAVLYLCYNYLQFGTFLDFGYRSYRETFHFNPGEAVKAIAAYLFSPALSIFLFSPPLLLALPLLRETFQRWELETMALLLAAASYLGLFGFFGGWDGGSAYGPRYMLAPIVLLMPLTLPAFERLTIRDTQTDLAGRSSLRWRVAANAAVTAGALVQFLGVAVYATASEWYRIQQGINDDGAYVFVPAASSIAVHLRELINGRNVIPWGIRVWSDPGPGLILWLLLAALIAGGCWWLARSFANLRSRTAAVAPASPFRTGNRARFAEVAVITMAFLVLAGLLVTRPIAESSQQHALRMLNLGLDAHRAGRVVAAQEQYALVLGLEPSNKFALYNLGLLQQAAGNRDQAQLLYQRVLQLDPGFAAAQHNLAMLRESATASANKSAAEAAEDACDTPANCYAAGKQLWDAGDKAGALVVWEKGAQAFPQEPSFVRNVARCRYDLGDYEGAVRDYQKAAALLPGNIGVRTDLAWALLKGRHFGEARALCDEVLTSNPGNPDATAILGEIAKASAR